MERMISGRGALGSTNVSSSPSVAAAAAADAIAVVLFGVLFVRIRSRLAPVATDAGAAVLVSAPSPVRWCTCFFEVVRGTYGRGDSVRRHAALVLLECTGYLE